MLVLQVVIMARDCDGFDNFVDDDRRLCCFANGVDDDRRL